MHVQLNPVDTSVFGRPVLDVGAPHADADLVAAEREWVRAHAPLMAVVKIKAEELGLIHRFEDLGFRFVECQLTLRRRITRELPVEAGGFDLQRVGTESELEAVLELASTLFTTDRISQDKRLPPGKSGLRYQHYIRKAFTAPDQEIWTLRDRENGAIATFGTQLNLSATEVRSLLGGVAPAYQGSGAGIHGDYLANNRLFKLGVRVMWTAVSAINYAVLPVHLNHMGYRVTQASTVLRKIYD